MVNNPLSPQEKYLPLHSEIIPHNKQNLIDMIICLYPASFEEDNVTNPSYDEVLMSLNCNMVDDSREALRHIVSNLELDDFQDDNIMFFTSENVMTSHVSTMNRFRDLFNEDELDHINHWMITLELTADDVENIIAERMSI